MTHAWMERSTCDLDTLCIHEDQLMLQAAEVVKEQRLEGCSLGESRLVKL